MVETYQVGMKKEAKLHFRYFMMFALGVTDAEFSSMLKGNATHFKRKCKDSDKCGYYANFKSITDLSVFDKKKKKAERGNGTRSNQEAQT